MPEPRDFAEFYADAFDALCVQLYAHSGSMAEAQDVVQEAFCRALARWPAVRDYDDPVAWVRKVAWNLATSRWRRLRSVFTVERPEHHEKVESQSEERLDLVAALKGLPEKQRQAVVLHYLADLSVIEVAAAMEVAEGTVKSWLHRARTKLAGQLEEVRDVRA